MKVVGQVFAGLAIFVLILGMFFGLEWLGIGWKGFFGPKHAAVERKVFESTKSFTDSKRQDLIRYHTEFLQAESVKERQAVCSAVRHMFADVDETTLSPELRGYLSKMRSYVGVSVDNR